MDRIGLTSRAVRESLADACELPEPAELAAAAEELNEILALLESDSAAVAEAT